ncbi:MAG: glycosyltransferase family 39 protein [Candidatus Omnitrophica bacterium]|nr:glycosyltransferase family 39 protein [Candidatus Omnitrophota bacterium]
MTKKYVYALSALFIFHVINNLYILHLDTTPIVYDSYGYFCQTVHMYRLIQSSFRDIVAVLNAPPLLPAVSTLFYFIFGVSQDVASYANLAFLIALLWSMYKIGVYMQDEQTGFLAAFILSTYPITMGLSRAYMLEFALTAMVCASWYFMLKTKFFTDTKISIVFGIVAGLGLLSKMTYPGFVGGPALYSVIYGLIVYRGKRWKIIKNFFLAGIITVVVSFFWYKPNLILEVMRYQKDRGIPYDIHGFCLDRYPLYYLSELYKSQLWWPYYLLFLFGLAIMLFREPKKIIFPAVAIFTSYLIFSSLEVRNTRHTAAYLPGFAIITALGLRNLFKGKKLSSVTMLCVVVLGIGQALYIPYSPHAQRFLEHRTGYFPEDLFAYNISRLHLVLNTGLWNPQHRIWDIKRAIKKIQQHPYYGAQPIRVALVNASPYFVFSLYMTQLMERLPIEFVIFRTDNTPILDLTDSVFHLTETEIKTLDYLCIFTYRVSQEQPLDVEVMIEEIRQPQWSNALRLIDIMEIPENTTGYLYEKLSNEDRSE